MIPNERLPPRNLHRVRAEKTQAVLKWQPPYDSPNEPLVGTPDRRLRPLPEAPPHASLPLQTYAVHVRDAVRKVERDYKVTTRNNTVEYLLRGLEPGGRYSVAVRLRNMSKEASFTLSTGNRKLQVGGRGRGRRLLRQDGHRGAFKARVLAEGAGLNVRGVRLEMSVSKAYLVVGGSTISLCWPQFLFPPPKP